MFHPFGDPLLQFDPSTSLHVVRDRALAGRIRPWRFNRPSDPARRAEIVASNKTDGVIRVGQLRDEQDALVCFDGNHRREAFAEGAGQELLVMVYWRVDNETLRREFVRVNKAVSVPDLYIDASTHRDHAYAVLWTVARLQSVWPRRFSPSPHPQRPNTNRDNLTQELSALVAGGRLSHEGLHDTLLEANRRLSVAEHPDAKPRALQACRESGCYLFLYGTVESALLRASAQLVLPGL